jgi:drug/metabolite transporter (DMT)-like permease
MIYGFDRGVFFMFFSALLSALNGAVAKMLGDDLSALEIVFFRNLFGVVFILITLKHTPTTLPGGKPSLLIWRGIFGFSALLLFFYTITHIPLGEAITLNKTSPLFVAILAFFILHERLSKLAIFALFLGFFGVVLITKPTGMDVGLPHLLGLIGGFLAAAAYTTIRKIKHIYDSRMIVLSFMTTGVAVPLVLFAISEFYAPESIDFLLSPFIMPDTVRMWLLLTTIGITATLSQWLLTKAYSSTNAGVVGIASYTVIPFSIFFGTLLGDKFPDSYTLLGIVLIVGSGLLIKKG